MSTRFVSILIAKGYALSSALLGGGILLAFLFARCKSARHSWRVSSHSDTAMLASWRASIELCRPIIRSTSFPPSSLPLSFAARFCNSRTFPSLFKIASCAWLSSMYKELPRMIRSTVSSELLHLHDPASSPSLTLLSLRLCCCQLHSWYRSMVSVSTKTACFPKRSGTLRVVGDHDSPVSFTNMAGLPPVGTIDFVFFSSCCVSSRVSRSSGICKDEGKIGDQDDAKKWWWVWGSGS